MSIQQKEELRRLVLRYLAERAALSYNAPSVQLGVRREMACTLPEVEEALEMLLDLELLRHIKNTFGAAKYYKVSAAGTLAYERGE